MNFNSAKFVPALALRGALKKDGGGGRRIFPLSRAPSNSNYVKQYFPLQQPLYLSSQQFSGQIHK
jgi:hypothetical protein